MVLSSYATLGHIYSMVIGSPEELKTNPRRIGPKLYLVAGAYYEENGKSAFNNWCKALFGPLARAFVEASEQYAFSSSLLSDKLTLT